MTPPDPKRLAVAIVLLTACAPDPPLPVKMQVLAPYPDDPDSFTLQTVELTTLDNLANLSGRAGQIYTGGEVRIDASSTSASSVLRSEGTPFEFAYFVNGGVVWPEDWHSLNAATTYFNFEQAWRFFHEYLDIDPNGLESASDLVIQYWIDYTEVDNQGNRTVGRDNAAWFPPLQSFWIFPFEDLIGIPLSMNPGIIAHEYSHAIFNRLAFLGQEIPVPLQAWNDNKALNTLKSMDEGFADAFAAEVVQNPNFIATSVPVVGASRKVDELRCYNSTTINTTDPITGTPRPTWTLDQYVSDEQHSVYEPYTLGSVIASGLWAAAQSAGQLGRIDVFRAMLDAQRKLAGEIDRGVIIDGNGVGFDLAFVTAAVASSATAPQVKNAICAVLLDRWEPASTGVAACNGVARENRCP
jgi:hypothetical protein